MRAPGGPRLLLRRLREVMAEPIVAQARLDRIVVLIASNMVAEVCSLYVVRADGSMELFATEGLNRAAVHLTTMQPDEGLVGLIASSAEPLALSDAQHHPAFSYRPETGEEIYQSFLGVPVLRGGATIGVLVVQNRARRAYSEEEIEALQTTAMLLAEMIASGELQGIASQGVAIDVRRPRSLKGVGIADGLGLGHVVMHQPRITVSKIVADDVESELLRLETAIGAMRTSVDNLVDNSDDGVSGEHRDVLEAFRMIAHDRGWLRRLREAVSSGLTAEAAVERVQNDARARLQRQTDPYLRDRLHDLTDIANRLLHQLAGQSLVLLPEELPENAILVARSMSPAALLDYDRARLRGLVVEEAGVSSHIAIVARALSIPAVSDIPNISEIVEQDDAIIVDGDAGEIHLRPQPDVVSAYVVKARMRAGRQAQYRALRDVPTISRDGVPIGLHMNAGLLVDMPHLAETGAKSIGLFRTELQFMLASRFPRQGVQETLYRAILDAAGERQVTFRTLDIGGDKLLPYMKGPQEENPALGWRALRIGLDRPALLRMQFRAFIRAATGRDLRVMTPMVSTVAEYNAARALFDREMAWSADHGHESPRSTMLGVMVEVPSLLWQIDEIAARRGLSFRRFERPDAIFVRDRSGQSARRRSLRPAERRIPEGLAFDRSSRRALRHSSHAVRRDRRAAARSDGADGDRLSRPLDVGDLDWSGEGDDAVARHRRGCARDRADAGDRPRRGVGTGADVGARRASRPAPVASPRPHHHKSVRQSSFRMAANDNLDLIHRRHEEIAARLAAGVSGAQYAALSRELGELAPVVAAITGFRAKEKERADLAALLSDPDLDPEMRVLAAAELAAADAQSQAMSEAIRVSLLPKDAGDDGDAILEVRAGTGGDEAALFAGDLFRMYVKYAETKRWKVDVLSMSEGTAGGFKEIVAEISGRGVFARLKFESGVHRVQRVPATETQGRIIHRPRPSRFCRSRWRRISSSARPISKSTPCAPAAPAGSMSTRPNPRSASPIFRPALSWRCRRNAPSIATGPRPWRFCARAYSTRATGSSTPNARASAARRSAPATARNAFALTISRRGG